MGIAQVASLSRAGIVSLASGVLFVVALNARRTRDETEHARRFRFMFSPASFVFLMLAAIIGGVFWVGAVLTSSNAFPIR